MSYKVIELNGDGPELIGMACVERPDIIVIDFQLPNIELIRAYRDIYSKVNTPIIMIITNDTPKDMYRAFDFNSEDYVTGPFKASELKEWFKVVLQTPHRKQAS